MSVLRRTRRLTFAAAWLLVCVRAGADGVPEEGTGGPEGAQGYKILPSGAVQLPPLNSSYRKLSSGPILILDQSTFYVTSLRYDGKLPGARFLVGNTSEAWTATLPDSSENLHAYWGQNVYLSLDSKVDDVEYLSVWSEKENRSVARVDIPGNIDVARNVSWYEDELGRKVIRLPKCCDIGEVIEYSGCNKSELQFYPITRFLLMNSTHIDNESVTHELAAYQPYVRPLECKHGKIPLYPEDNYFYLQNGSLLYIDGKVLLAQDQFCVETVFDEQLTLPFVCLPSTDIPEVIYYIYASGMLLSSVFFLLTAAIFYFVFEDCKVRIKCIIAYSLSMAGSFITLSSAQLLHVEGETCNVLGYILEFFFVLSFAWLAVLSYETQYIIKKRPAKRYPDRIKIYAGVTTIIATVLVILTAVVSEIPFLPHQILKPQFGRNTCVFDERDQKTIFFYIPITISIFVCIGYLAYAKYLIVEKSKNEEERLIIETHDSKNKFRACWMVVTIATLCWIMEVVSFAVNTQSGITIAMDIVECLQGVFVFIIFVLHNPVKDKVLQKLCKKRKKPANGHANMDSYFDELRELNELSPLGRR